MEELNTICGTQRLETERRAQYEELTQIRRDQENGYDVIKPPMNNGSYGTTYEELKHGKEEHRYEKLSAPTAMVNYEKLQNKTGHVKQPFEPSRTQSNRQPLHFGQDYLTPIGYRR
ncbi:uncharacterized protein LOC134258964 [Saccostrea cucullata]|uniref:uncharacterized protein LOC134258964 n=1 Tax=Saccostrea cuccullata TaxID=36930 RepID=UPI002ED3FF8C